MRSENYQKSKDQPLYSSFHDHDPAGACGIYCGACPHYGKDCPGCSQLDGDPFWGECLIKKCAQEDQMVDHCGYCPDFPCEYFLNAKNTACPMIPLNDRIANIVLRRKLGTDNWLTSARNLHKQ